MPVGTTWPTLSAPAKTTHGRLATWVPESLSTRPSSQPASPALQGSIMLQVPGPLAALSTRLPGRGMREALLFSAGPTNLCHYRAWEFDLDSSGRTETPGGEDAAGPPPWRTVQSSWQRSRSFLEICPASLRQARPADWPPRRLTSGRPVDLFCFSTSVAPSRGRPLRFAILVFTRLGPFRPPGAQMQPPMRSTLAPMTTSLCQLVQVVIIVHPCNPMGQWGLWVTAKT